jgi:hypothetical protein
MYYFGVQVQLAGSTDQMLFQLFAPTPPAVNFLTVLHPV